MEWEHAKKGMEAGEIWKFSSSFCRVRIKNDMVQRIFKTGIRDKWEDFCSLDYVQTVLIEANWTKCEEVKW